MLKETMLNDEFSADWDQLLTNYTWSPASYQGLGNSVYSFISYVAKATKVIFNISNVTSISDDVKNRYIAETKVLRAWFMYVLYDYHGAVNVETDPLKLFTFNSSPRPTTEAYLAQIEDDLITAISDLSARYNGDSTNWGRISQGVAQMLLLKLYMINKQWDKAEAIAKNIMGMGYSLMPNYADVFNIEQNNELIYAVPANSAGLDCWIREVIPGDFAASELLTAGAGCTGHYMPWGLYDKYENNDTRKTTIVTSYTNQHGKTVNRATGLRGAIPVKYTSILNPGADYNVDVVVFRYAEVLLSLAEAINEQRGPNDAYQYVNMVRARAGVSDFAGMKTAEFRAALQDERKRELYCEGTHRQDFIRQRVLISNTIARNTSNARLYRNLFPIQGNSIVKPNTGIRSN